ncbi:hypothetical protein C5746_23745 [Streptomyces atratus]|uniref:Uncharacterized protein n=1 Tax=Streptomyces atratus TaxID=1893 RepID=A0A2Z5JGM4_STRAR|nr:hypothetical protein C5746_23745 [Streptomyces atratus]
MVEERRPRREVFSEPCCTVVDRTFPSRLPAQAPVIHPDVTERCTEHTAALPHGRKCACL